jgi:hypothetical protein
MKSVGIGSQDRTAIFAKCEVPTRGWKRQSGMVSWEDVCRMVSVGALIMAFPAALAAAAYLRLAMANARPEMRWVASLPFSFFFRHFYTEIGNVYRRRFLALSLCFLLLLVIGLLAVLSCGPSH